MEIFFSLTTAESLFPLTFKVFPLSPLTNEDSELGNQEKHNSINTSTYKVSLRSKSKHFKCLFIGNQI